MKNCSPLFNSLYENAQDSLDPLNKETENNIRVQITKSILAARDEILADKGLDVNDLKNQRNQRNQPMPVVPMDDVLKRLFRDAGLSEDSNLSAYAKRTGYDLNTVMTTIQNLLTTTDDFRNSKSEIYNRQSRGDNSTWQPNIRA